MSLDPAPRRPNPARLLVCLDLRERLSAPAGPHSGAPAWRTRAAALLKHARRAGWPVAHLLAAHPAGEASRWRAIAGLSPIPAEPVFYHADADPGGNPAFLRFAGHYGGAEILLMGNAAPGRRLAALARSLPGRELAIAADAVTASPREWQELVGLAAQAAADGPRLRLAPVDRLIGAGPALRLIAGGLAQEEETAP